MDQDKELIRKPKHFLKYFSNPWVGLITAIATIISLVLAIVFFRASRASRNLKFFCHPVKAQIYKSGQASGLEVFYENKQIQKDIIAVQVAIWNDGKMPIKKDEILEGIEIYTKPECSIIDAAVRKRSRDLTELTIDNSYLREGRILISWRILERNDGAIIQIIFAGDSKTEILIKGTIEGQRAIDILKPPLKIKSPQEQIKEINILKIFGRFVILFLGAILIFAIYDEYLRKKRPITMKERFFFQRIYKFSLIFLILYLILTIFVYLRYLRIIAPPFGFE